MVLWKETCRRRDKYRCKICGKQGYLEVHHITSFANIMKKFKIKSLEDALKCSALWDIGNGMTLCRFHHRHIKDFI